MSNIVSVAVAVICYQQRYLLGFRNASQHQGNRYEFIGGKINANETPKQGLIREVKEEIGCDVANNLLIKMGVIEHDYHDKQVILHIFKIELNLLQYQNLQITIGNERQTICWVDFDDLIANQYPLPDANRRILDWLTMPTQIIISQDMTDFAKPSNWLDFYVKRLGDFDYFYPRLSCQGDDYQTMIHRLGQVFTNLHLMINYQYAFIYPSSQDFWQKHLLHLNHQQLMSGQFDELPQHLRYFASCHDIDSIHQVNAFAKTHRVMGCFLSPVFTTATHPQQQGMGWQQFANIAKQSHVPVYALGGMQLSMLDLVRKNNGFGVAGIRLLA